MNNGRCVNREGSFSCECPEGTNGKLCQFNETICEPNPCGDKDCYPKETAKKYECLTNVTFVSMEFKLNHYRIPFDDWMLNDVTKDIENAINDAASTQNADGRVNKPNLFLSMYLDFLSLLVFLD